MSAFFVADSWRWALLPVLAVAVVTDAKARRIPNWLTFPAMVAGLLASVAAAALAEGWRGAVLAGVSSLGGWLAFPLAFLLIDALYAGAWGQLKGIRAGDIKLMAAAGAWIGFWSALSAILDTALVGGVISLLWAALHGALGGVLKQVRGFFMAVGAGLRQPAAMVPESRAPLLPYALSIALGTIAAMLCPPLWQLGVGR
ncbi:MAG: A24 family peptidase [Candidatus Sericytochromatia bacterium]|nr:A24 family peptidase [Candidatus Sericytochromatia bacterium]